MPQYSEQDLKYASQFRDEIHREALTIVRKTRPDVREVVDRHPVEDYFQEHWDYPGKWYTVVAIPSGYRSRKALVESIVRSTLAACAPEEPSPFPADGGAAKREPGRRKLSERLRARPAGYRELFTVDVDQERRSTRAVGVDAEGRHILEHYEEYSLGGAVGSVGSYYVLTGAEFRRYARLALVNGQISQERYDGLAAPGAQDGDASDKAERK